MQLATALFERLGIFSREFLSKFFFCILKNMSDYRNCTKQRIIPTAVTKQVHATIGTLMTLHGVDLVLNTMNAA